MITMLVLAVVLATMLVFRARLSLWIGLAFPVLQAFYSPSLLRLLVIGVLCAGIALGWRDTTRRHRQVLGYVWTGVLLALTFGWALAPDPALARGMVVNLLYAAIVASLAIVYRMSAQEWSYSFMALGVIVSAWLAEHDVVVSGRTGSLYIGENANALGMLAALGFVGSFVFALRRPLRAVPLVVGVPSAMLCAMGVLGSGSRGALLVVAAGVVVHLVAPALRRSPGRAILAVSGLAVVMVWAAMPALNWFLTKAGRNIGATTNFDSREQILRSAFQAGVGHPMTGVGFGSLEASGIGFYGPVSPHNAYVGLFAAAGVLPAVLLAILVLYAVLRSLRSEEAYMPLLVAAVSIGFSLDWVPTAKLGPIVLALLACAAALPDPPRRNAEGTVRRNVRQSAWRDPEQSPNPRDRASGLARGQAFGR